MGISSIILARRNQQVAPAPDVAEHTQDSIKPQPHKVVSGGSQLNGERSPKPHTTQSKIDTFRPKVDISTLKNLETMRLPHDDIIGPPPPLPDDVLKRRNLMLQELANSGKLFERRDSGPVLSEEASQIELEALTRDMNQEDAVAFLEKYGIYNEAILNRISPHRAFKYLKTIRASYREVNAYAEKALAENPNDFEAKMHLLRYESDNAKAAEGYQEILAKEPNHISAMLYLAYRTHYDDPRSALQTLSKVNKLDPIRGYGQMGLAYERLGDVKTAWLYYKKHLTSVDDPLINVHIRAVERGEPRYSPIHLERQAIPQIDKEQMDKGVVIPEETPTHVTEEMPWFPELPSLEPQPWKSNL